MCRDILLGIAVGDVLGVLEEFKSRDHYSDANPDNKQVSKLLLHIVYPLLPASGDTGEGYAEVCVSQTSRMHFNKIDTGLF